MSSGHFARGASLPRWRVLRIESKVYKNKKPVLRLVDSAPPISSISNRNLLIFKELINFDTPVSYRTTSVCEPSAVYLSPIIPTYEVQVLPLLCENLSRTRYRKTTLALQLSL